MHFYHRSEGELLASARHSIAESTDMESTEFETSLESSFTTVSSWHETSVASLTSEIEMKASENGEFLNGGKDGRLSSLEGQPDLICEVGLSSSQQPDLVSSQEVSRSFRKIDCFKDVGLPPRPNKSNKKKRTTHKDIKSRVKAMINKGKLKLSDSVGKKKRKSVLAEDVERTFKKTTEENTERAEKDKKQIISEMKRNLTALLSDVQIDNNKEIDETDKVIGDNEIPSTSNVSDESSQNFVDVDKSCQLQNMTVESNPAYSQPDQKTSEAREHDIFIKVSGNNNVTDTSSGSLQDPFDSDSNENLQQLQRRYSTRKQWSRAQRPDAQRLLSKEALSVADSLEGATYMSIYSCSDFIEGEDELEPEIIEEIRINKTKWKQVVAQIKDQCSSTQLFSHKSSMEESETASGYGIPSPEIPQNIQVVRTLETEFETPRMPVSPKPQRKRDVDGDENRIKEEFSDNSPNSSKDSDDYLVIGSPEKEATGNKSERTEMPEELSEDYLVIAGPEIPQITNGITTQQPDDVEIKKSTAPKASTFGLSPLITKAKEKFSGSSPFSKGKVDTDRKIKKETKSKDEQKSKLKSRTVGENRSPIKKVKKGKIDHGEKDVVDTNVNLNGDDSDKNEKDLATELAEAAQSDLHSKNPIGNSPELTKTKQRKKKSPKGTKIADLLSKDHESVMQILASRTLVSVLSHLDIIFSNSKYSGRKHTKNIINLYWSKAQTFTRFFS